MQNEHVTRIQNSSKLDVTAIIYRSFVGLLSIHSNLRCIEHSLNTVSLVWCHLQKEFVAALFVRKDII